MERLTHADRACAVAAAAAHDLNDELTIIVNTTSHSLETLEPGHPARPLLLDLQRAAQRQETVVIGYVDAAGVATQRVVSPITVTGGQLVAFDSGSGRAREFAVHRITSVVSEDDG